MARRGKSDALDEVVDEVRHEFPELTVQGLPISGRILRLARHVEQRREAMLAEFGLTPADFDMLATMRRKHAEARPLNVRELQRSSMLSSGGTTKRLDRLEQAGFIERSADPDDRRGVLITLTVAGYELINEVMPAISRAETALIDKAIPHTKLREQVVSGLRSLLVELERG